MRCAAAPMPDDLTVVKLGGSLAYSPYVRQWLAACRSAPAPVIVVTGGGPFADTVRDAQARMGLGDGAAHRMALLAMAQFAEALASLEPGFTVAQGFEGLAKSLDEGSTPIWAPLELLAGAPGIEESWDVTSDSLASWLAAETQAKRLILVKQAAPDETLTIAQLSERGIVDRAFPVFMEDADFDVVWLGEHDYDRLGEALAGHVPAVARDAMRPASTVAAHDAV